MAQDIQSNETNQGLGQPAEADDGEDGEDGEVGVEGEESADADE